jgi:hypothetical protein
MKIHTQLSKHADNISSALETHADTHLALFTGNFMKIHTISSNMSADTRPGCYTGN